MDLDSLCEKKNFLHCWQHAYRLMLAQPELLSQSIGTSMSTYLLSYSDKDCCDQPLLALPACSFWRKEWAILSSSLIRGRARERHGLVSSVPARAGELQRHCYQDGNSTSRPLQIAVPEM